MLHDRRSRTCQGRPGSYSFEAQDAAYYCEIGLTFTKTDACGGTEWPQVNTSWIRFAEGFEKCKQETGRSIFTSVEYCRPGEECLDWVGNLTNMWRDTSDIQANWDKVLYNADQNIMEAGALKRAQFPDPDMLEVGQIGLDYDEQKSHMSLWVVMTAPLLISADPTRMDPEVLELLKNDEVYAVN